MTTTTTLAPAESTPATSAATKTQAGAPQGHIGRIVTLTIVGGSSLRSSPSPAPSPVPKSTSSPDGCSPPSLPRGVCSPG